MKVQVSEFIVKYLERLGVKIIFGMPGAHILPVYDNLYDSEIQSVLVKHEQGASFMACGYTRASGNIGACISTAGPGATNLITGIANAYVDKQPVIIITGETPTYIFGKGGLQESSGEGGSVDQSALFSGITKYNKIIERTDYLPNVLNRASKILLSDNSGPVLLSIPYNVQKEMIELDLLDDIVTEKNNHAEPISTSQIDLLTDYIVESKKPVIVSGYGCIKSGAQDHVSQLSKQLNIPVTSSLKGKGSINECSNLSLGSLGVTSNGYAFDYIINQADLVIVLGASFNERTSYLWNDKLLSSKRVVQVDINEEQLEKVYKADLTIHADIKHVISSAILQLNQKGASAKELDDISLFKKDYEEKATTDGNSIFQSEFTLVKSFFDKLNREFPGDISVFDDNIIFAQTYYTFRHRIDSIQTLGFHHSDMPYLQL